MIRPCQQQHPRPRPDECLTCRKFVIDPRYRQLFSGDKPRVSIAGLAQKRQG